MTYNLLVKTATDRPDYLIDLKTAIATRLSENKFKAIQSANPKRLGDYRFTDYSWWERVTLYMTENRIYKNVWFVCDLDGNIRKL